MARYCQYTWPSFGNVHNPTSSVSDSWARPCTAAAWASSSRVLPAAAPTVPSTRRRRARAVRARACAVRSRRLGPPPGRAGSGGDRMNADVRRGIRCSRNGLTGLAVVGAESGVGEHLLLGRLAQEGEEVLGAGCLARVRPRRLQERRRDCRCSAFPPWGRSPPAEPAACRAGRPGLEVTGGVALVVVHDDFSSTVDRADIAQRRTRRRRPAEGSSGR